MDAECGLPSWGFALQFGHGGDAVENLLVHDGTNRAAARVPTPKTFNSATAGDAVENV